MADQPTNQPLDPKAEKRAAKQSAGSTQAYLNIAEVKDGVVVLKDGSLRQVLMTSSLNFALKSNAEQDGIIYAYQRFLNSLTFPVQILVQSRRLDLDYYLDKLSKRADSQEIELVKLQILEYTEFIKRLISVTNIMDKRFFVIVPFYPTGTEQVKGLSKLFTTSGSKQQAAKRAEQEFEKNKVQLRQRVEAVASGLGGLGLRAVGLNSEELVELFYSIYNPGTSTKERLLNVDELTAASIEREGGVPPEVLAQVETPTQVETTAPAETPTPVQSPPTPAPPPPVAPETPTPATPAPQPPATPETAATPAAPTPAADTVTSDVEGLSVDAVARQTPIGPDESDQSGVAFPPPHPSPQSDVRPPPGGTNG